MANIRTFIAVELPDEAKREIGNIQDHFANKDFPLAFPKKGILHLTLAFLDDVEETRLPNIIKTVSESSKGIRSFSLEFSSLGAFPNFKLPKVVWLGLGGEVDKLKNLERKLKDELQKEKFDSDEQKFVPHITIARVKTYSNKVVRRRLGEEVQRYGKPNPVKIPCSEISIFKSTPTRAGYVHEILTKIPLQK